MNLPVNSLIKLTLSYVYANASVANNVFIWSLGNLATEDVDVVDAIELWVTAFWGPAWQGIASSAAELVNGAVDVMNPDGTVAANLGIFPINLVGSDGAPVTSAAVSGYLLAQTELPKARGSKYLPGVSEGAIGNGEFTPAAIADLSAALLAYLANIQVVGAGKLFPGILSRTLGAFVPFNATGSVESIPAYQRRRKPYVGS